jgi:predicted DNA-binding transcriptional regulator YafY
MSNTNQLQRQLLIIRKVLNDGRNGKYPSIPHLLSYLEKQEIAISIPTIKRDFACIKADFKIDLEYSAKEAGYYIDSKIEHDSAIELALENFEILSSLNQDGGLPSFVIPEKRKSKGTEHFYILSKYIENRNVISFNYHKYDSETVTNPVVLPQAIKESRGRWYLLAVPQNETEIKSYGLDRIEDVSANGNRFPKRIEISELEQKYRDCFAMFTIDTPAEKVVLSFDERDGNYIASYPIHHSQTIEHIDGRVIVGLNIKITLDFIMELMSRSWSIQVLEPISLREELHRYFTEAMLRNAEQK